MSEDYPASTVTALGSAIKLGDTDCAEDYVTIPQGTLASKADSLAKDRYDYIHTMYVLNYKGRYTQAFDYAFYGYGTLINGRNWLNDD